MNFFDMIGVTELIIIFLAFLIVFLPIPFMIWAIVSCANSNMPSDKKTMWLILIIFLGIFGSLTYLIFVRPKYYKKSKKSKSRKK